jgi:hypothetical protein
MADANPNPGQENASAEPHDTEGLDAATDAFAQQGQPEDKADDPAHEPDDEAETDAEGETDADPEDAEPEEELAEVEISGKTYKVPKELQKGYLRQADYSRQMNEVQAEKKAYAERLAQVDAVAEGATKLAESLAVVKGIEAQLAQLEAIDWTTLESQDPVKANSLALRQLKLTQQLNQASAAADNVSKEVQANRASLMAKAKGDMDAALKKDLKGWGDDLGAKLTTYAISNGVQLKTLQELTDPGVVIALNKAKQWDELQASKAAIKGKGQAAPPVTKPGTPRAPTNAKAEAMKKHRSDGSVDSAAAAFLALGG